MLFLTATNQHESFVIKLHRRWALVDAVWGDSSPVFVMFVLRYDLCSLNTKHLNFHIAWFVCLGSPWAWAHKLRINRIKVSLCWLIVGFLFLPAN